MKDLNFVDQTLRDAQQSLWGFKMTTDMLAPILPVMDEVGYKAIATVGARGMIVTMRGSNEDPFARIKLLTRNLKKTPVRSSFWTFNLQGFDIEPMAPVEIWIKVAVNKGIRSFWICDYQNMMHRLPHIVGLAKSEGAREIVVGLLYTLSPVHTDELYEGKVRKLVEMGGVDAIHVEDMAGMLTPERAKTLLPALQRAANGIPIEFHAHCNMGLAPMTYVEAIKMGVPTLHTAVSPLANDTSLPSIENTLNNVRRLGYGSGVNEDAIRKVSQYFEGIAEKHHMRTGKPLAYDIFQFEHQMPGGMMGTLRNQLTELGQAHRMEEVLEEVARIREELGYPYMATPYSQIVGAQAVFNVTSGQRYKLVSDETIKYVLGLIGEPDGTVDETIKDRILSTPKAKKWLNWRVPEITTDDIRRKIGSHLTDEALLIKLLNPQGEVAEKLKELYDKK